MKIGIIGSDDRAVEIGRLLAQGGHEITFSDTKQERARQAAAKIGVRDLIPYNQAMRSEVLVIAVPPDEVNRAVTAVGSGVEAVIIDAVDGEADPAPRSTAEIIARSLDTHNVVRAKIGRPQQGANIAICGDDAGAKAKVEEALHSCGCVTTDRGPLSNAKELEPPAA
jgi:predicted dinucleotide-binding enzyme